MPGVARPAGLRRRSPPGSGGTPPRRRADTTHDAVGPDSERSRRHPTGARGHATHARTPPQLRLGRTGEVVRAVRGLALPSLGKLDAVGDCTCRRAERGVSVLTYSGTSGARLY